jgi:tRNA nucleotidyltransferase/poly(A) polymerase
MTKTELFKFAEVGSAVRDSFLNVESKDVDFTAIPLTQFNTIEDAFESLVEQNF